MDGARKLVTSEVATLLNTNRKALIMFLSRNEELKPVEKLPSGDFLWSQEEYQRLKERRAKRKRRTVKKKGGTVPAVTTTTTE